MSRLKAIQRLLKEGIIAAEEAKKLAKSKFLVKDISTGTEKIFDTEKKAQNFIERNNAAIDRLTGPQYTPEWKTAQKKNYVVTPEITLDKIREGSSAVKEGSLKPGELLDEANRANPANTTYADQKAGILPEWAKIPVLAGLTTVGASMMSPDEAEAAGLTTIAKKLGIGLEEAAKIKALAKRKVSPDVFEENIKAIQSISGYKKDPSSLKSLGSGMDYKTFELPNDQVLKVPKTRTAPDEIYRTAPSLTEEAGIGPKTKLIEVGNNLYMTQDKVTPINKIIASTRRPGQDPIIESLYKKQDKLWENVDIDNPNQVQAMNQNPEYLNLQTQLQKRENELLKQQGLNLEDLQNEYNSLNPREKDFSSITYGSTPIETDPEGAIEDLVSIEARRKLGNVIRPQDTHSANVGLDKSGKRVIFDTSRFEGLRPENLSPEQKQKILENYIAKPEQKANLENLINSQQDFKKAAAFAPISAMGPNEFIKEPARQLADLYKENIQQPISDVAKVLADRLVKQTNLSRLQGDPESQKIAEQYEEKVTPVVQGAMEMAADPTNFMAPGIGIPLSLGVEAMATPEEERQRRINAINNLRKD